MDQHPGEAVEREGTRLHVRAHACMSVGFLTAEALLQSDSTTMQAKRAQADRMLSTVSSATAAGLAVISNKVCSEHRVPSNYASSATWVWGRL